MNKITKQVLDCALPLEQAGSRFMEDGAAFLCEKDSNFVLHSPHSNHANRMQMIKCAGR